MKVKLAQMSIKDGATSENLDRMLRILDDCDPSIDLVVFPETTLCGFPSLEELSSVALSLDSDPIELIKKEAQHKQVAVAFGFAESAGTDVFNTAVLIDKSGKILLRYRKTHLWPHTDRAIFSAGDTYSTCILNGLRLGLLICYDVEFPETARALARLDVDLILVLDGNMEPYGPVHRRAVVARAMENQCFAILVNRLGNGRTLKFAGESVAVNPFGEVIADARSEQQDIVVHLDSSLLEQSRHAYSYLEDVRTVPTIETRSTSPDDNGTYELKIDVPSFSGNN